MLLFFEIYKKQLILIYIEELIFIIKNKNYIQAKNFEF